MTGRALINCPLLVQDLINVLLVGEGVQPFNPSRHLALVPTLSHSLSPSPYRRGYINFGRIKTPYLKALSWPGLASPAALAFLNAIKTLVHPQFMRPLMI